MVMMSGGDVMGELSEVDLDHRLQQIFKDRKDIELLPSGSAVRMSKDKLIEVLNASKGKFIVLPFWCMRHWTLMWVANGVTHFFDSAHSDMVLEKARKFCGKLRLKLVKMAGPEQMRGSAECGVFVLGFALGLAHDREFKTGKVSLAHVRPLLSNEDTIEMKWFEAMYGTVRGGGVENWFSLHDKLEGESAKRNLCYLLTASILVNAAHELSGAEMLEISIPALVNRARRLNFGSNQQHDCMEAIGRMADRNVTNLKFETANVDGSLGESSPPRFLKDLEGDLVVIQWATDEMARSAEVGGWSIVMGATYSSSSIGEHGSKTGHYRVSPSEGRIILYARGALAKRLEEFRKPPPEKKAPVAKKKNAAATSTALPKATQQKSGAKINVPQLHKSAMMLAPQDEVALDEEDLDYDPLQVWRGPDGWSNEDEKQLLLMRVRAPLGALKGSWLACAAIYSGRPKMVHTLVWSKLAPETRKKHSDWLLTLKAMPADLCHLPFATAVVELVLRLAGERGWVWSTVSTNFSCIETAVKELALYSNVSKGYDLGKDPYFASAKARAGKLARIAGPSTQLSKALPFEEMEKMLKACQNLYVRTLLAVSYYYASRIGDLRQVHPEDVGLPPNDSPEGEVSTITYKLGKGGAFWGPFTIAAVLPRDVAKDFAQIIAERKKCKDIWKKSEQAALSSLVAAQGYNLRSIRRGALLWNADKGVDDHQLQLLSGHKRLDTLMRYLGWGRVSATALKAAKDRYVLLKGGELVVMTPKNMGPHAGYQGVKGRRVAKPPTFFWYRPPTNLQLGLKADPEENTYPLHIKEVDALSIEAVREMARGSVFEDDWREAVKWLTAAPYDALKCAPLPASKKIPKAKFSEAHVRQLLAARIIEPLEGEGKSWTNMFPHVERVKKVIRVLGEPHVNRWMDPKHSYPSLEYSSRYEKRNDTLGSKYAMEFDLKTYFYQFWLDEEARNYHAVRTCPVDGVDMFRLTRLSMGAKFSPSIAQLTTWIICEPLRQIPGVKVSTMIDNVRILADDAKEFVKAVRLFLSRTARASMSLNEDTLKKDATDEDIIRIGRSNVTGGYDFLGERFTEVTKKDGVVEKYVANTKKLVEKLRTALDLFALVKPTLRQVAALVGLMLYMAHTLYIDLADHFGLIRGYAQIFEGCPNWDEEATVMTETMSNRIRELAQVLLKNDPVLIRQLSKPSSKTDDYDAVVVFDACQNAWAARVFIKDSAEVLRVMRAFASPLKHSAHAEPTAAKDICAWLKKDYPQLKNIALVTDHLALASGQRRWWSGNGGFSTAFPLNEAFREINNYAQVFHVEGLSNVCDEDSRSALAARSKTLRVEAVREVFPELSAFKHPFEVRKPIKGF